MNFLLKIFGLNFFATLIIISTVNADSLVCPANYILITPQNPALSSFCVSKYEMKNVNGVAVSMPEQEPWANINRFEALAACEALGSDFNLISNAQWQDIAYQIEDDARNWSSGNQGEGAVNVGHAAFNPNNALAASNDDNLACFGKNEPCDTSTWNTFKRTHNLPNGLIWDFSGNVGEWVLDNNNVSYGIYDYAASAAVRSTPFLQKNFSTKGDYTATTDLAALQLGRSLLLFPNGGISRGSSFGDILDRAGIYFSDTSVSPDLRTPLVGFRCVYQPKTVRTAPFACPESYIAVVPTDLTVKPFCVAKYEMKNEAGSAVSKAEALPWNFILREEAVNACESIGSKYGLIRNAEWQAVASEIESNPNNWSGGEVGLGNVSVGHSDQNPFTSLAASADDRNGCFGTNEFCDTTTWSQSKRTQSLIYGTIWDMSGNVSEWVLDDNYDSYGWRGHAADPVLAQLTNVRKKYGAKFNYTSTPNGFGLGYLNLIFSNGGLGRGGSFDNTISTAGVYTTDTSFDPDSNRLERLGFRCVYRPDEVAPPPGEDPIDFSLNQCLQLCAKDSSCKQSCRATAKNTRQAIKAAAKAVKAASRANKAATKAIEKANFAKERFLLNKTKSAQKALERAQAAAARAVLAAQKAAELANAATAAAALANTIQADSAAEAAEQAAVDAEESALSANQAVQNI